jgi:hypothetical protein
MFLNEAIKEVASENIPNKDAHLSSGNIDLYNCCSCGLCGGRSGEPIDSFGNGAFVFDIFFFQSVYRSDDILFFNIENVMDVATF